MTQTVTAWVRMAMRMTATDGRRDEHAGGVHAAEKAETALTNPQQSKMMSASSVHLE